MLRLSPLSLWLLFTLSCGGLVTSSPSMGTGGASTQGTGGASAQGGGGSSSSSGGTAGSTLVCSNQDITLCNDGCSDCQGQGCGFGAYPTPSSTQLSPGYCPSPSIADPGGGCDPTCPSGACSGYKIKYVWLTICDATPYCAFLLSQGIQQCTYEDGTPWTGAPIVPPNQCPVTTTLKTCNGPCGPCPANEFCGPLSPSHPIGTCLFPQQIFNGTCGFSAINGGACASNELCYISATSGEPWQGVAQNLGQCLPKAACIEMATKLLGGGACYDMMENIVAGSLTLTSTGTP